MTDPLEIARQRMRVATVRQLLDVLAALQRGEDVGVYRDAARPFTGVVTP